MIPTTAELREQFIEAITRPTPRDQQVSVGPSELGGCVFCIGYNMARSKYDLPRRERGFGYAAWLGRMCHEWLEHNLELPTVMHKEHRVHVFDIAGYGPVHGTIDLLLPEWGRTIDFKFPGKYAYEKTQLGILMGEGPSTQYRYQGQGYAYGANRVFGDCVELCTTIFFPRHTNSINDMLVWEEPYNPAMAELLQKRTEAIWEDVEEGRLGDLDSDPDCFECDEYRGSGRPSVAGYLEKTSENQQDTSEGAAA